MNDRLRERIHDPDPGLARAARLAAAVPAIASSQARRDRVRRAVAAAGPRRSLALWLLRPSTVLVILLVAGAVMAATAGRAAIGRAFHRLVGEEPVNDRSAPAPTAAPAPRPSPPPVAPERPAPPQASTGAAVAPRPVPEARVTRPQARRLPEARVPVASEPPAAAATPLEAPAAPPPTKVATAQESALLMSAVRALRHERDPARASALLDDYMRRYPSGLLVEEALALAIEAASARGDGRAAGLARTYLQRYPHGRFVAAAKAAAE